MVWQSPEAVQSKRQALWRGAAVWGLFALLLAGAVGVQWAGGPSAVSLGERVRAGDLSARPPAGWRVTSDAGVPKITAADPAEGGGRRSVAVMVLAGDGPRAFFRRNYGDGFEGAGRRVEVAGRTGTLVEFAQPNFTTADGVRGRLYAVAAASLGDGRVAVVESVRGGLLDDRAAADADAALVRGVAADVRLAGDE